MVTTYYGNTQQLVSLYGSYGVTDERQTNSSAGTTHYTQGTNLAATKIVPLCTNGNPPGVNGCSDTKSPKIIFLFLGFSNCDVEICGGHVDAWDASRRTYNKPPLLGQACATKCPNPGNPENGPAYNEAYRGMQTDGYDQLSFLRLVYPPPPGSSLVGGSVVVFDGALGQQSLDKWDPTPIGYCRSE